MSDDNPSAAATVEAGMTAPKLKTQILSDREVDAIEGYQAKIRALRDRYLSFELALEEARKELVATKAKTAAMLAEAAAQVKTTLAPQEEQKAALEREIERLSGRLTSIQADLARFTRQAEEQQQADQTRARQLDERERDLNARAAKLDQQEGALVAREQAAIQKEGEADRAISHQEEIHAHTKEVEARVAQAQAQLDVTLEAIKNNRVAEVQARQDAEAATRTMEAAKSELMVVQQERDDLRRKTKDAEAKYQSVVELHDQAQVLEQTNKVKEIALRDVQAKLTAEQYQLRQARSKFLEEVEAHRRQCEDCAAKAAAQPGGTNG